MIISRYLAKEVYSTLLATTLVLVLIFASHQFVRYMHYAAAGELTGKAAAMISLLQLPLLIAMLLPLGLYLAILLAYGRMYADSEMTALMAAGYSPRRLLLNTLGMSGLVVILVAILSLYVVPLVAKYSERIWSGNASNALEFLLPNRFNVISNGKWIFYVDTITKNKKQFKEIFAAEQPESKVITKNKVPLGIVTAKGGYQRNDPKTGDSFLVLTHGHRYLGIPGELDYQLVKYDIHGIRLEKKKGTKRHDVSAIPTVALWKNRGKPTVAAELQWRLALPIMTLVLTLLGTVLSKVPPRSSKYVQLMPAVTLYIIYVNFVFMSRVWLKKAVVSTYIGIWWIHATIFVLAMVLIMRQFGWRRVLKLCKF